jgi:hypothetical protein
VDATEVKVWRRQERARLIALRMGIPSAARREWDRALATLLYPAYERQLHRATPWPKPLLAPPASPSNSCDVSVAFEGAMSSRVCSGG